VIETFNMIDFCFFDQSATACYQLGALSSAVWSTLPNNGGISLKYTGGSTCYSTSPYSSYSLEVFFKIYFDITLGHFNFLGLVQIQFTCDASQTPGKLAAVIYGSNQCNFVATFPTAYACPGAAGGSSAGAWAFNLIVLIGLPVYFAGGYVYLWKAKGAEGHDRIPHYAFWTDLPLLVKDGCIYFIYLCKLALYQIGGMSQRPEPPVAFASQPAAYDSTTSSGATFGSAPSTGTTSDGGMYSYGGAGSGYGSI
jgi:predicted membrane channel-forming protein YqfA (hemolysin III family)